MQSEYVYALIGISGTLLGVLVGSLITFLQERIREKEKVKAEVQVAINEVLFNQVVNDLPKSLANLRAVIVKNAQVLSGNEKLTLFFRVYLNDVQVLYGRPLANAYEPETVSSIKKMLGSVKL
jgi:hypothetical protein